MIGLYDNNLCNLEFNALNETITESINPLGYITGVRCSNLPVLLQLLIYVPMILGIIYLLVPIPFKV